MNPARRARPISETDVTAWPSTEAPSELSLRAIMSREGLRPYSWSNGAGDVYAPHRHDYDKVIYVVSGSITFGLPRDKREIKMQAGDRLDLPAGTVHDARVGPEGVLCLEAHK
jgi:mannose-6-phosphate isomerase-like protein (cupin superfamily)